jgi:hypothetical protein
VGPLYAAVVWEETPEVQRHVAEVEDYGGLTERVCNTHFLQE